MPAIARPAAGGGALLARNASLNLAGQVLPLLVAFATLPLVIRGLGVERFGILTLAWTFLGYFGFFDLGLGRATTKFVSAALGEGRADRVGRIVATAAAAQVALGLAGALVIAATGPLLAGSVLRASSPAAAAEAGSVLRLVAAGLPFVLLAGTFSGALEARQRFDLINAVRVPASAATFLLPLAGVYAGLSLTGIVALLLAARAAAMLAFLLLMMRALPETRRVPAVDMDNLRNMLGFGGWVMLSMMTVPLLSYAERLLIASLGSLTQLTYYATPFEIVARTAVIPGALALTLFPAFSFAAARDDQRTGELLVRSLRFVMFAMLPLLLFFWSFAGDLLHAWLGADFARESAPVLRVLAFAFFLNAFAQIALAAVHGFGRPDLKARLDLVEVPLFLGLAAWLIPRHGVLGAAYAKVIISAVDLAALSWFAAHAGGANVRSAMFRMPRGVALGTAATAAGLGLASLPIDWLARGLLFAVVIGSYATLYWARVLDHTDRSAARSALSSLAPWRPLTPPDPAARR